MDRIAEQEFRAGVVHRLVRHRVKLWPLESLALALATSLLLTLIPLQEELLFGPTFTQEAKVPRVLVFPTEFIRLQPFRVTPSTIRPVKLLFPPRDDRQSTPLTSSRLAQLAVEPIVLSRIRSFIVLVSLLDRKSFVIVVSLGEEVPRQLLLLRECTELARSCFVTRSLVTTPFLAPLIPTLSDVRKELTPRDIPKKVTVYRN